MSDKAKGGALATRKMANAIRALAMDAVEAAKSGHPGMPMGMADVATVLFTEVLKFDAAAPRWPAPETRVSSRGRGLVRRRRARRVVAQLVAQRSPKPQVAGSSPVYPARRGSRGTFPGTTRGPAPGRTEGSSRSRT